LLRSVCRAAQGHVVGISLVGRMRDQGLCTRAGSLRLPAELVQLHHTRQGDRHTRRRKLDPGYAGYAQQALLIGTQLPRLELDESLHPGGDRFSDRSHSYHQFPVLAGVQLLLLRQIRGHVHHKQGMPRRCGGDARGY
jgi:hypothetical protein